MDVRTLAGLPGADLVIKGLDDLASRVDSVEALLVQVGASNLRARGVAVPRVVQTDSPEHLLYRRLEQLHGAAAHSRHNALVRRLVSFERALACVIP